MRARSILASARPLALVKSAGSLLSPSAIRLESSGQLPQAYGVQLACATSPGLPINTVNRALAQGKAPEKVKRFSRSGINESPSWKKPKPGAKR